LEVVRDGHRWRLNPSDYVQEDFFWLGTRDMWDLNHAGKFVRNGSVLFDVGANFGYYSVMLADALKRNCKVHAFEPFPPNFERLSTNVQLNGLQDVIRTHQVALSDNGGVGRMTTRLDNLGSASLNSSLERAHQVPLTTLDSFCRENDISTIDFMKIDVEGHEEHVLDGGMQTLRRLTPALLIELDPPRLERAGTSVTRIVDRLRQLNYQLYVARRETLQPLAVLPTGDDLVNAFCLQERHLAFA